MAKVLTWKGSQGNDWNNALNWLPNDVPSIGSDFFSDTTVVFGTGSVVSGGGANFFVVNGDTTFSTASVAEGQSSKDSGQLFIVNFTAFQVYAGTATFSGQSAYLTTYANVLVGYHDPFSLVGSNAELDFLNGAHGSFNTSNIIDVNGTRIYANSLHVGDNEDGTVKILGSGTQVTTDSGIAIAANAGVHGTVHVGDGANLHVGFISGNFGFYVGYAGSGELLIDGSAKVQGDGFADIGVSSGSSGTVTVDGAGSDWHQAGVIAVGFFPGSTGSLTISNGATVETDVSVRIGSGGTVMVNGGSALTASGTFGLGGRISVDAGAKLLIDNGSVLAPLNSYDPAFEGIQVAVGGLISGTGTLTGAYIVNDGTIDANTTAASGTLVVSSLYAPISDPGTPGILSISGNATLELRGGVAANETVVFNHTNTAGGHETLVIDGPLSDFHAPIKNLAAGDVIDIAGLSGATTWSFNSTTDVLTVSDDTGTKLGSLQLVGNYDANAAFNFASDGHQGFLLTQSSQASAPVITSGGGGSSSEYVLNAGKQVITTVQASGTDVHYFIQDPKTGKLVTSTSQFSIDTNTGLLSYTGKADDATLSVTVVSKNSVGQDSQKLTVDVDNDHLLFGNPCVPDTFVFHAGFKNDAVVGFRVEDASLKGQFLPHDVLQFDHGLFNGATAGESGDALFALVDSHAQSLGKLGTLLNTDTGEHIFLVDMTKQSLLAHLTTDFHLV